MWLASRIVADALHAAIEVGLQLLGELLARRLVRGIPLVSKRQTRVVHPAEVVGPVRLRAVAGGN